MTAVRKPLPPLPVRSASKLPPLPRRTGADADWLLATKSPRRGNCVPCAGRGHFVWHASDHIKLDCSACNGTGGAP